MLGWSFGVSALTDPEDKYSFKKYAYWEGGLWSDEWLQTAVKFGAATQIVNNGGYPDIYEVVVNVLPEDKVPNLSEIKTEKCMVEVWDQS